MHFFSIAILIRPKQASQHGRISSLVARGGLDLTVPSLTSSSRCVRASAWVPFPSRYPRACIMNSAAVELACSCRFDSAARVVTGPPPPLSLTVDPPWFINRRAPQPSATAYWISAVQRKKHARRAVGINQSPPERVNYANGTRLQSSAPRVSVVFDSGYEKMFHSNDLLLEGGKKNQISFPLLSGWCFRWNIMESV